MTMKRKQTPSGQAPVTQSPPKKKKGRAGKVIGKIIRRFFLILLAVIIMLLSVLVMAMNQIFNGPSPAARDVLTMSLLEPSATKWIPGLFLEDEVIAQILAAPDAAMTEEVTNVSSVTIEKDSISTANSQEWADAPDGIRFEEVSGDTFNAHVMIVRDPSRVYLGTSSPDGFSRNKPGKRINHAMEDEGAVAAVNAGAFFDNGTAGPEVGSTPEGLVYSNGSCVWKTGAPPNNIKGFAGFNEDDILVVHRDNITEAQAEELNIRDGCCFGPVLIMNGEVNMEAYNKKSGWNPRTAIGQRADGAVIFVCIDGRQASSVGGDYADIINIMQEFGAVNACNMDGGSSSVMMYRDTLGRFGPAGELRMMNSYSLLQSEPRKMPDYWMVRPESEG